jgi:PAS domain S-box-containing protein
MNFDLSNGNRDDVMRDASAHSNRFIEQAYEEVRLALDELQAADAELRRQNEELTAAGERLKEYRFKYQELFHLAPDGYLITDNAGVIVEANLTLGEMLGTPTSQLTGKPLVGFVPKDQRRHLRECIAELLKRGMSHLCEIELQPRGQGAFIAELACSIVQPTGKGLPSIRWIIRDITERKLAASAREASLRADAVQREVNVAIDRFPGAYLVVANDWRIVMANRRAEVITRLSRSALIGKPVWVAPPFRGNAELHAGLSSAVSQGQPFHSSIEVDGERFRLEAELNGKELVIVVRAEGAMTQNSSDTYDSACLQLPPSANFPGVAFMPVTPISAGSKEASTVPFWDVLQLGARQYAFTVANVTLPPDSKPWGALELKAAWRTLLWNTPRPALALSRLNDYLASLTSSTNPAAVTASLSVALVNTRTGKVIFASAGCQEAAILTRGGDLKAIPCSGGDVGVAAGAVYEEAERYLAPDDIIVVSTMELSATEALRDVARAARRLPLADVAKRIAEAVNPSPAFRGLVIERTTV